MNENEPIEIYGNGPLPLHFKERAYFTSEKSEFALRQKDALEYLNWCKAKGLAVLGYEVWYATTPGPTVPAGWVAEGNAEHCRDGISKIDVTAERERAGLNAGVVFNIDTD